MNHYTRVWRDGTVYSAKQDESAHRLAIRIRREDGTRLILRLDGEIDDPAHCRCKIEISNCSPERYGSKNRTAIGIDRDNGIGEIMTLRESEELARRIRRNCAGG